MVVYNGDQLEGVFLIEIIDGKITHFYAMRNPDKLLGIAIPRRSPATSDKLVDADRAARRPGQRPSGAVPSPRPPTGAGLAPPAALIGEWFGSGPSSRRR